MSQANPLPNLQLLDQYQLHQTPQSALDVLVITDFIDQEYLYRHRAWILDFLEAGKIVVANTHLFRAWLPNVGLFMPKKITRHEDYRLALPADNQSNFYTNVDLMELAYRRGVAGFYARGYHPIAQSQAEILLQFESGEPVVFIDRHSTRGTMMVGACRDFLSYETGENTTKRIVPQFLDYLTQEWQRLQGVKS